VFFKKSEQRRNYRKSEGVGRGLFKKSSRGYILIVACIAIPILLLAVKYCMDKISLDSSSLYSIKDLANIQCTRRCANEAALEVAKKWNPGLTLKQQKESLLRIADKIYNESPPFVFNSAAVYNAIPGLMGQHHKKATQQGKKYDPLRVIRNYFNVSGEESIISQTSNTGVCIRYNTRGFPIASAYVWYSLALR